ncbi:MAG: metalloregulator ArsR/SmtB family transcription factor [Pseudomonadota bacterium]
MPDPAEATFRALADPTRRAIVALLAENDMTIGAVADNFDMTRPAVKKHLSILEQGALIRVEARGRERINRLNPHGLQAVSEWVAQIDLFWSQRLAALKDTIEKEIKND